jgi:hypothetical protein
MSRLIFSSRVFPAFSGPQLCHPLGSTQIPVIETPLTHIGIVNDPAISFACFRSFVNPLPSALHDERKFLAASCPKGRDIADTGFGVLKELCYPEPRFIGKGLEYG